MIMAQEQAILKGQEQFEEIDRESRANAADCDHVHLGCPRAVFRVYKLGHGVESSPDRMVNTPAVVVPLL